MEEPLNINQDSDSNQNIKKMKKLALVVGCVLIAAYVVVAAVMPKFENLGTATGDPAEKERVLIQTLIGTLNQMHFNPKKMDDDFSKKIYKVYLDRTDGARRWFTQEDIDKLKKYETLLDDETNVASYEFFDLSLKLEDAAKAKTQAWYQEFLAKPFDYNKNETIELDGEKRGYSKNDAELKEHWRKMLKYEVLSKITSKLEEQEKDNSKDRADASKKDEKTVVPKEKKTFEQIEIDSRKDVLKTFDDWYKRLNKAKRMDQLSDYLNCITNIYDPHTGYFEPKDKQKFDTEMSGRFEGIGARLQQENDYIKVSEIIPGGPAYRQKELEAKDLIMKVAQKDAEPVDIAGMDMDDVVSMIKGKKGTEVRLTVKKVDGTMKVVTIIRDEVVVDEGFAKSLMLNTKSNGEKIGYIKLPRFYADFENPNGRTCSQDVAIEIEKLKTEGAQGIILDLRWNGGGSLRDVIDMSGMFVDKGPMVQVKGRSNKVEVYEDTESGVLWDKPIIILVNQGSASASEIIAAALQDYGRAVIVGAKGTYGKGTVQRFVDLDKVIGNSDVKPLGQVKLTIQKFYRINGGSTQLRGVTPDIILPDAYNYIEVGEKENEYPMEWNEVAAANYQKTNSIKDMAALRNKSEARVKRDATFTLLEENAKRLKKQKEDTKYPIGMKEYRDFVAKKKDENKKYEDMFKPIDDISSINLNVDVEAIKADSSHIGRNDDFIKGTKKDVQLYETMNIMHDLIKQN